MTYTTTRDYGTLSRYSTLRVICTDTESYLESPNKFTISEENCRYHIVEQHEANRLDIISQNYYDDASYYWVIALANNIIDPFIIIPGTILKIPDFNNLFQPGGPLYNIY